MWYFSFSHTFSSHCLSMQQHQLCLWKLSYGVWVGEAIFLNYEVEILVCTSDCHFWLGEWAKQEVPLAFAKWEAYWRTEFFRILKRLPLPLTQITTEFSYSLAKFWHSHLNAGIYCDSSQLGSWIWPKQRASHLLAPWTVLEKVCDSL